MKLLKNPQHRVKKQNSVEQRKPIYYSDIPELDDAFWERASVEYPENMKKTRLKAARGVGGIGIPTILTLHPLYNPAGFF